MKIIFIVNLVAVGGIVFSHFWLKHVGPVLSARRRAIKRRRQDAKIRRSFELRTKALSATSGHRSVHVNSVWSDK